MTNQQSTELTEPGVGSFDDPSSLVAAQFATVLEPRLDPIEAVGNDQIDASPLEPLAQGIGVVGAVGDYTSGLLSRPAPGLRDADFGERGFRKRNFCRCGTFQPNSQRKTPTVDQYHPLRCLAALGFTDCGAPFLAGAKLPSRKVSSHFNKPFASSDPSSVRHASSQTPCSSHCFNLRQQVAGEGYLSGRNRQAAPVCSTHRMPSRQSRLAAQGRPRPSLRTLGAGSRGSIFRHCASLNNSNRFLLMQKAHQITRL